MRELCLKGDKFRILQLTDLHLMGLESDEDTFALIRTLIVSGAPDLVVVTGDLTMVKDNRILLVSLRDLLSDYDIPWTFVFGNHDHESLLSLDQQADILMQGKNCLFEKGDRRLSGVGNHFLKVADFGKPIALLCFLDTHNDRIDVVEGRKVWSYDCLDSGQIEAAKTALNGLKRENKAVSGLFFFHTPLKEFAEALVDSSIAIQGENHEPVSCSRLDFGFVRKLSETGSLKGCFVGHDHVNDFSFVRDDCLFAYGRCTGHYNYTRPEFVKGGRIIEISPAGKLTSSIILEQE